MNNKSTVLFLQLLNEANLSHLLRVQNQKLWLDIVNSLNYVPVNLSPSMMDYQCSYYRGNGTPIDEISIIIMHDKKPCGVWPLSIIYTDTGPVLGSCSLYLETPKFIDSLGHNIRSNLISKCISLICLFAYKLGIRKINNTISFDGNFCGINEWHDKFLKIGATVNVYHDLYLNLKPDINIIKGGLRKSYKSLINSGSKIWDIGLLDHDDIGTWSQFKDLHFKAATRLTRSNKSWELQLQAIKDNNAVLVYLRNNLGVMVGGGFFHFTRDESEYAVGAYARELFDKPLGHIVQFRAIEFLKSKGVKWHKLGPRPYRSDLLKPSEKEITIADFKQGFSSHILPRYLLEFLTYKI